MISACWLHKSSKDYNYELARAFHPAIVVLMDLCFSAFFLKAIIDKPYFSYVRWV